MTSWNWSILHVLSDGLGLDPESTTDLNVFDKSQTVYNRATPPPKFLYVTFTPISSVNLVPL